MGGFRIRPSALRVGQRGGDDGGWNNPRRLAQAGGSKVAMKAKFEPGLVACPLPSPAPPSMRWGGTEKRTARGDWGDCCAAGPGGMTRNERRRRLAIPPSQATPRRSAGSRERDEPPTRGVPSRTWSPGPGPGAPRPPEWAERTQTSFKCPGLQLRAGASSWYNGTWRA